MSILKRLLRPTVAAAAGFVFGALGCCGVSSTGSCLRSQAIRTAGAEGDERQLEEWLRDERSWVREEAALAAGHHRQQGLRPMIWERLMDAEEAPWVRAAAARALGQLDVRDVDTLTSLALATGTPPEVKLALVETVCRADRESGASRLTPLKNDPDLLVAAAAERKVQTRCAKVE